VITHRTALCGHDTCDPYQHRNSVLDDQGDVVLYNACDGVRWVFRDNVCHGLTLHADPLVWTLTREGETELAATITLHGVDWAASWPTGRVFIRHDTGFGLVAKVARRLLTPAACCRGEAL
jgi:hypothetical protein